MNDISEFVKANEKKRETTDSAIGSIAHHPRDIALALQREVHNTKK